MATCPPLVVSAAAGLIDDVLRLAVASGAPAEVVADPARARSRWPAAPVVLVGRDQLVGCAERGMGRRDGVVVVTDAALDPAQWRAAVAVGADDVLVLPGDESALVQRIGDAAEARPGVGIVMCCVGARGGAGASTLSCALALSAAGAAWEGVLLVDLDPWGGGLDLALGAEDVVGPRWPELCGATGRVSARALHDALPLVGGVSVLATARGPAAARPAIGRDTGADQVDAEAARSVVAAARRAGDVVVVDLPRRLSASAATVLPMADTVLLVTPTEVRATASAGLAAAALRSHTDRAELVVRRCGAAAIDPQLVAQTVGLPLAAVIGSESAVVAGMERGEPLRRRSSLAAACRTLVPARAASGDGGRRGGGRSGRRRAA
ncbi:MAG: septum site-determining protein Ssd [Mycobacteriales bacterium]|nr:MAG: hypothetical protein DLM56_14455 [Pseudonocardiales bacterium]